MASLFKTLLEFFRLREASSLFDRGYTLQFELDGLRRPRLVSSAGLRIEQGICYHPQPAPNSSLQSLDIYAAESEPGQADTGKDAAYPVVVFMHGGGWRASDKNDPLSVHANVCKALALRGLVVVNVNYRLSPQVKHPEHARDAAYAFRWVRENIRNYRGDPESIFLSGHSAGGHLAALISLDPEYLRDVGLSNEPVKGVIGICGVYNLVHFAGRNWMAEHLMTRAAFGNQDDRAAASPLNHVRASAPPFLLINAQHDERLEEEAEELAFLLRMEGVVAETAVVPGTNHFTILSLVGNGDDTLIDMMEDFVRVSRRQ